jgi:outer membrane protein insertion porin family
VGGTQKNLATDTVVRDGVAQTEGYIPNIKVFRLTGMDIVRGFNDEEINRVPGDSKDDISEVKIDDRAYLANFKVEPRYFINDALMAGVFYDAGRVFVNKLDMGELRDSVGVTFKILTPVGTLDFDYGIKLLRERNKNGTLEDPGRFHVSIGFF